MLKKRLQPFDEGAAFVLPETLDGAQPEVGFMVFQSDEECGVEIQIDVVLGEIGEGLDELPAARYVHALPSGTKKSRLLRSDIREFYEFGNSQRLAWLG